MDDGRWLRATVHRPSSTVHEKTMDFIWPAMLIGLVALPILIALYFLAQRRRSRYALRFSNLGLLREVATGFPTWQRHIPPVFFLFGIAFLLFALARPQFVIPVPKQRATVILAIDVSRSMDATDIKPTRLDAAKEAAKTFVKQLPKDTVVGVVSFAGFATLAVAPTDDHKAVEQGIDALYSADATAIGDGLLTALGTPPRGARLPSDSFNGNPPNGGAAPGGRNGANPSGTPSPADKPIFDPPDVIVLMSDGASNRGRSPIDAAFQAKDMKVPVYVIGVGTEGAILEYQGRRIRVDLDEATLKDIADITGAEYFNATTAQDLSSIYKNLGGKIGWEEEKTEITFLVAAGALAASLFAGILSLLWFQRFP
jgi:Ca-activated chloride channel family protein